MRALIKKIIPFTLGQKLRGLWQKALGTYYRGKRYHCPFCKNSFRKMLPGGFDLPVIKEKHIIGAGRRNNDVCPRCYSTDRDRLLYLFLQNKTDILKKKNVKLLHIAPAGAMKALLSVQDNIEYIMGTKHHQGFYYSKDILIFDITNMDYPDNTFDVILCNHVLEHIEDDIKAMAELHRVLKPGGWAILQVPISYKIDKTYENPAILGEKDREAHFGQFDHVRIYGKDYFDRLGSVGFRVIKSDPFQEDWGIENIEQYALNREEAVFMARKEN
ncbi:MAG: methyltransferase domain-containing protein [Bacteroidota bacterium]|nr:methyltransferase domain-containing protein [Bacteroidota bacterium]